DGIRRDMAPRRVDGHSARRAYPQCGPGGFRAHDLVAAPDAPVSGPARGSLAGAAVPGGGARNHGGSGSAGTRQGDAGTMSDLERNGVDTPGWALHLPIALVFLWWMADLQVHWRGMVEFQHGWLVVPLAGYLAWERWNERPASRPPRSPWGPVGLA